MTTCWRSTSIMVRVKSCMFVEAMISDGKDNISACVIQLPFASFVCAQEDTGT